MSKAEEIAKQYASELIESGAIKDYQRSWMESVYIHIYNSRQSEIDELKAEVERLRNKYEPKEFTDDFNEFYRKFSE